MIAEGPFETDPIRQFEDTHTHLTGLARDVGRQLRDERGELRELTSSRRREVFAVLGFLGDRLLDHFADEEEALFPFLRRAMPTKAGAVDKLEANHDAICGAVVRLSHLAGQPNASGDAILVAALFDRFEQTYAEHSRAEANLFEEVGRVLGHTERAELRWLLRGLSQR
jgi:hypothetical protein